MGVPTIRYEEYKDSYVTSLGAVPSHWQVKAIRRIASINPSKSEIARNISGDQEATFLPMESVGTNGTINPRRKKSVSELWNGFTYFERGDVIVAKITPCFENGKGAFLGDLPTQVGFGSTEFHVLRPSTQIDPQYLYLLTVLHSFRIDGEQNMVGSAGQKRVPVEFLGSYLVPVPPLDEQQAIARFLDRQDRRINRFIRAKRRMIELLNEQKQAIIHQAVTRGLDPNVPLKPSGIDWLGDIPAHWQPTPLKTVANVQTGITIGKDYGRAEVGEYPYLRVANVQAGHLNLGEIKTILVPQFEASRSMLQDGDVLMTEGGDIDKLGRGAVWRAAINPCLHQNHVFAVRPVKHMISPEYLVLVMSSRIGRIYFETTAKKTTNLASTNSTTLKSFLIPLPTIQEQSLIREELSKSITHIDSAVFRASREIDLIREYRTRFIADVVTGKLDVRNHPDAQERVADEGDDDSVLIDEMVDELMDKAELEEDDDAVAD